jgi:serine/threonine protein kinase
MLFSFMPFSCPYCGSEHPDEAAVCPTTGREIGLSHRLVGKSIGKYEILRLIGEGGMGAVFEARHTEIRRKVALKLINAQFAKDPEVLARFSREARATGEIGHENIIEIYDIGNDDRTGATYLVLELLHGKTLQELIDEKSGLSAAEAVDIMLQVLSALAAAHTLGIIHRDLKPENVFLITRAGRRNWVKLLDFGIAKIKETEEGHKLTQTGAMMGTPFYMAPEQIKGEKAIDQRLDVYACGVILYQCITGKVPFDSPTIPGLVYAILNETPMDSTMRRPGTPQDFSAVIRRAMARDPAARFSSALEMARALEKFGSGTVAVDAEIGKADELARTLKGSVEPTALAAPEGTSTSMEWGKTGARRLERRKRTAVIAIALFVLLSVTGLGIYYFGFMSKGTSAKPALEPAGKPPLGKALKDVPEPPGKEKMVLAVTALPAGAAIFIDGASVGGSPYKASFEKSDAPRLLEVRLDGFEPFAEWVKLDADVFRTIKLVPQETLTEEDTEKPGTKKKKDLSGKPAKKGGDLLGSPYE